MGNAPRRDDIKVWVYALADPETGEHFYVGSSQDPETRLDGHVAEAASFSWNKAKAARIKAILARGLRPALVLLESAPNRQEGWRIEEAWARECLYRGCPLVPTRRAPYRWQRKAPVELVATSFPHAEQAAAAPQPESVAV